jgi:pseudaminic acid synthase
MSANHDGNIENAFRIIEAAKKSGADAVKLQTYRAETMTLDCANEDFRIKGGLWDGKTLYELYQEAHTPWEWHKPIFDYARKVGITVFSTPFDETAVDLLEDLDAPCYKIASFENADLPLIRNVAATGKPVIVSTGMATLAELDETVRTLRENGCKDIVLLKCTSTYPATPENSNLNTIPHMRELFGCEVGLSDHTLGIGVAVAAVALGATVIEKHFTLSRADGGVDSAFSMEPHEMAALVAETKRAWQALGNIQYGPTEAEIPSLRFRRSIYITADIKAGDRLSPENMRIIRPGYGLAPKFYEILIGKQVKQSLKKGTALAWKHIG